MNKKLTVILTLDLAPTAHVYDPNLTDTVRSMAIDMVRSTMDEHGYHDEDVALSGASVIEGFDPDDKEQRKELRKVMAEHDDAYDNAENVLDDDRPAEDEDEDNDDDDDDDEEE